MRRNKDFEMFASHLEWWEKDWDTGLFIPTDKAPKEIVEAIERVNERIKWEQEQGADY